MRIVDIEALMDELSEEIDTARIRGDTERIQIFTDELNDISSIPVIDDLNTKLKISRWIRTKKMIVSYRCEKCDFEIEGVLLYKYCPECGAKMQNSRD